MPSQASEEFLEFGSKTGTSERELAERCGKLEIWK